MLKIDLKSAKAEVRSRFWGEGSVLSETVTTHCSGIETRLMLESDAPPEKVAKLARIAEQGCYVIQSLRHPTEVDYRVELNGSPLATDWSGE